MALLRNCFSFLLLILVARLLPQESLSAPVKKFGPFRRAEDVQEFCRGDGHTLNCYEEGYFVQPEQCPLNITDPDCLLCNTTSKSSSPPKDSVSMMEDSEELEETEEMLMVCNRMEVSEVPSDDDDDDVADSCLCATSSENCTNCNRCNVSVAAVTTAALNLKTAIIYLQYCINFVEIYLRRRAECLYQYPESAAELAIKGMELRRDEIFGVHPGGTFDPHETLCGKKILNYDDVVPEPEVYQFFRQLNFRQLYQVINHFRQPGTVCNSHLQVNSQHRNPPKRLHEVTRAMKTLKALLEAYSYVTRMAYQSDCLCCYISRCEVVPRIRQALNILDVSALQEITKDVLGRNLPYFQPGLDGVGKTFGAKFDCRVSQSS